MKVCSVTLKIMVICKNVVVLILVYCYAAFSGVSPNTSSELHLKWLSNKATLNP